jgi:Ca2+-binding RTX toxin-like protein
MQGGLGDDSLIGGSGNDVIFGGDDLETTGQDGNDTMLGGLGSDSLIGGSGNDVIFGGDDLETTGQDGNDTMLGGLGNDSLIGGSGNDVIFGGDDLETTAQDGSDTLEGSLGDDSLIGGSGDDVIFGGDDLETAPPDGSNTLKGGLGNDSLIGGSGNDIIFGGAGNDVLTGNDGTDTFEGGSGSDRIAEARDADMMLGPTTISISGTPAELHYDFESATLTGGPSNNLLDASTFPGAVVLIGLGGNDTLIGGEHADQLFGGSGDDNLLGNDGDDTLDGGPGNDTVDGGSGNDIYLQTPGSSDLLNDVQGIDSVDLSSAAFAINVDLGITGPQTIDAAGNVLTFAGGFENLRGTSYSDLIKGNTARNILDGGGGIDSLDGAENDDTIQGSFPQLVYLDFDSATGLGEKVYSIEERNAIQARLEQIFGLPFSITFTQTRPPFGRFTTVRINSGGSEENEPLVGGLAHELDWRNFNAASLAEVNVNGFLGRRNQPAASSDNYVALTTTVVAHEFGHLLGLRHSDSFGPLGLNPVTGLPYGIFAALLARSVSHNESVAGTFNVAVGPNTLTYQLGRGPVVLEPATQAGNSVPNAHELPSGTVFDGSVPVASFTVDPAGDVQIIPLGGGPQRVIGGTLDANTATLELEWLAGLPLPTQSSIVISYSHSAPLGAGWC